MAKRGVEQLAEADREATMGYVVYNNRCLVEVAERAPLQSLRAEHGNVDTAWPRSVQAAVRNVVWQADTTRPAPSLTTWLLFGSVGAFLGVAGLWIVRRPSIGYVRSIGGWREWLGIRKPRGWDQR